MSDHEHTFPDLQPGTTPREAVERAADTARALVRWWAPGADDFDRQMGAQAIGELLADGDPQRTYDLVDLLANALIATARRVRDADVVDTADASIDEVVDGHERRRCT